MKVKKILTNTSKKSVVILGDSMLKNINGWEISKRLESDSQVYVNTQNNGHSTVIDHRNRVCDHQKSLLNSHHDCQ